MAKEAGRGPTPSDAAVRRLRSGLQDGIASYASVVDADVDEIARAVADERDDQALEVVRHHLERLEVFADEVRRVVAGAAVEREAEGILDGLDVSVPAAPAPPALLLDPPPDADPPTEPDQLWLRRRLGAAAGRTLAAAASIVVVALLTVSGPASAPDDPLLAAVVASEEVQAAAVGASAGSLESIARLSMVTADLRSAIAGLDRQVLADPVVRQRLQAMLADHQQSLATLSARVPQAGQMLQQLRDLASQLDLDLPPLPTTNRLAPTPSTTLQPAEGLDDLLPGGALPDLPPLPTTGLPDPDPDDADDASTDDASTDDVPAPDGDGAGAAGEPAPDDPAPDDPATEEEGPPSAGDPAATPPATDEEPGDGPPAEDEGDDPPPAVPPGPGSLDGVIGEDGDLGAAAPSPQPTADLPFGVPGDPGEPPTAPSDPLQP